MPRVDASEEMKRGQIAQREAQKSLTGGPSVASLVDSAAAPRMNIKVGYSFPSTSAIARC